jgi:hypothetical protein
MMYFRPHELTELDDLGILIIDPKNLFRKITLLIYHIFSRCLSTKSRLVMMALKQGSLGGMGAGSYFIRGL